jgi:hypothetical protein
MADRSPMLQSDQALTPAGRRVLAVIEGKVERGGGLAAISYTEFRNRILYCASAWPCSANGRKSFSAVT